MKTTIISNFPPSNYTIFQQLRQNEKLMAFCEEFITDNYISYFTEHTEELLKMLQNTFALLRSIEPNQSSICNTFEHISNNIFKKKDANYWFNIEYKHYKKKIRAESDYKIYQELIYGNRLLDFGSGGGYNGLLLQNQGFMVFQTDVLDYRIAEAFRVPFIKMDSPDSIPIANSFVDTTIIKGVLHHIDKQHLEKIVSDIYRVTKNRLILEEDVVNVGLENIDITNCNMNNPYFCQFCTFSKDEQYLVLCYLDYFANLIAGGLLDINMGLNFMTIEEWLDLFIQAGFKLVKKEILGFQSQHVNKTMHAYMVLDVLKS
ncbi:class I SAM-dependent methyltransferase [Candidatus Woesebacteria bacterium]|nr:class I SAM-dependent methyltransferase [Candidatus Woesebacteria bacterium]